MDFNMSLVFFYFLEVVVVVSLGFWLLAILYEAACLAGYFFAEVVLAAFLAFGFEILDSSSSWVDEP